MLILPHQRLNRFSSGRARTRTLGRAAGFDVSARLIGWWGSHKMRVDQP